MLLSLSIQNLILIERAEISFGSGLNILTGETGSGKSAVLSAIRLISGERADVGLIRKGADLAVIEATVTSFCPTPFLEESLPLPPSPLRVRREIHRSGRSRCFIEDQLISLSFLRACIGPSIERVDQSSSQDLCTIDEQRKMLDTYADLLPTVTAFAVSFEEERAKEAELQNLLQMQTQKERELEWAEKDLKMIEEVNWQPSEEEKLNQDHKFLSHAQQLLESIGTVSATFSESLLLPELKQSLTAIDQATRFDAQLAPLSELVKSAILEIEEAARLARSYCDRIEADPNRLLAVEKRLSAIESLKRRFSLSDHEQMNRQKEKLLAQIDRFSSLDTQIEDLRRDLEIIKEKNRSSALLISQKRKERAPGLSAHVLHELQSLNLPHAKFTVSIQEKPLTSHGLDEIRFLFSANPGVDPIALEQCASGGELSRLLLSMKTVLAEKEGSACLAFDEIDSNVGGQTAAILGEKLKKISQKQQVICVTHFVQVASFAMSHFLVSKQEREGQAYTTISPLFGKDREHEYNRMLGK